MEGLVPCYLRGAGVISLSQSGGTDWGLHTGFVTTPANTDDMTLEPHTEILTKNRQLRNS